MFFLGSSGSLLPYIISLVAIWSGFILGYGQYFSIKKSEPDEKLIVVEKQLSKTSENIFELYSCIVNPVTGTFQQPIAPAYSYFRISLLTRAEICKLPVFSTGVLNGKFIKLPETRGSPSVKPLT